MKRKKIRRTKGEIARYRERAREEEVPVERD